MWSQFKSRMIFEWGLLEVIFLGGSCDGYVL